MFILYPTNYTPPMQIVPNYESTTQYDFELLSKDSCEYQTFNRKEFFNLPELIDNLNASFLWENELTTQIDYKQTLLPSYYLENFNKLSNCFSKELSNYHHYLTISEDEARVVFKNTAALISELPFEKGTVELTPSNSITFTVQFPKKHLLIISRPFHDVEDLKENEIIFSFFVDRELILSNAAVTSTFVEEFKEFLTL